MKEFIEKLIGRLEERIEDTFHRTLQGNWRAGVENSTYHEVKDIVNQLAEEYKHCALCYLQSPCEYQNENAILPNELLADNNGWIPCSERLPSEGQIVSVTLGNGVVTAVESGTATITVTTEDGNLKASCVVTVKRENDFNIGDWEDDGTDNGGTAE